MWSVAGRFAPEVARKAASVTAIRSGGQKDERRDELISFTPDNVIPCQMHLNCTRLVDHIEIVPGEVQAAQAGSFGQVR
jgi:hypothetical protein